MDRAAITELIDDLPDDDVSWVEFLRRDSMSVGVYRLAAGADDPQDPHAEDEVYYVVSGRARLEVDGDSSPVEAGDVVFVEREVDHRFHDVEKALVTLVFFAPAEGSLGD